MLVRGIADPDQPLEAGARTRQHLARKGEHPSPDA